ncbi:MAG: hypothetical protein EXS64_14180 [Candidatus Latescibacteria bacterium]|nr:hypothetical protein [Candidatus Latescibacterota bacterium]
MKKLYPILPDPRAAKDDFIRIVDESGEDYLFHFKKIGNFWSVRAGIHHRALAIEDGEDYIWVWIGVHDEYKRMI